MATSQQKVRFGEFSLDLATGELWRAGERLALQDLPFRVLQLLVAHPGEVVTRTQLIAHLWPKTTFIDTDVGLNTAVRKLRATLGDDSEVPRYVETLPRRGYRFLQSVDDAEGAADRQPRQTRALMASLSRARWWWLGAAAIACTIVVADWLQPAVDQTQGTAHASRPPVLALMPFVVGVNHDALRPQIEGMAESLRQGLSTLPGLRVVTAGSTRSVSEAPDNLLGQAQALRADMALTARVVAGAGQHQLRLQLMPVNGGGKEWRKSYPLTPRDMTMNVARMQGDIVQRIAPDSVTTRLNAQLAPLQAEYYVRAGNRAVNLGTRVSDWHDAIVNFEQALKLDPDNPRAWCLLAGLYMQDVYTGAQSIEAVLARALPLVQRGLQMQPVSEQCLMAQWEMHTLQGQRAQAREAAERALSVNPRLSFAQEVLAQQDATDGKLRQARDTYARIVREHPDALYTRVLLAEMRAMTGDPAGAHGELRALVAGWPDAPVTDYAIAFVIRLSGDHAGAVRAFESALAKDPAYKTYALHAAIEALEIGATDKAAALLSEVGHVEGVHYRRGHIWLLMALGEPQRALAWYRSSQPPPTMAYRARRYIGQARALSGDREGALEEYRLYDEQRRMLGENLVAIWPEWQRDMVAENHAALMTVGSAERERLLRALEEGHAKQVDSGESYPLMLYRAAVHAALRGRVDEAMRQLDAAMDAGYGSSFSLRRDLVWLPLQDDARFRRRHARMEAVAAEQRSRLARSVEARPAELISP